MTETWFDNTLIDPEIKVGNYTCSLGQTRPGGRSAKYIRSDVALDVRNDMICIDLEVVWVNILHPKQNLYFLVHVMHHQIKINAIAC